MNTTWIINRYQLSFMRKSLVILTFVMVGVVLLSLILGLVMQDTISFMSLEISTAISVFVCGLNSFKECFGFSLQNAASRKNVYLGTLLAAVGTALAFAVMEYLIFLLTLGAEALAGNLVWETMVGLLYPLRYAGAGALQMHVEYFFFNAAVNLAMFMTGFFITTAYYRMNKLWKVIISVGVPVFFIILLPVIFVLTDYRLMNAMADLLVACFGLSTANPWCAVGTFTVLAALMAALTWPLIRRAVIKE